MELHPPQDLQRTVVLIVDLCGTLAFALSGAMAGVRRRLDVFVVLVLAFFTSSFGGISRDLLIGATPLAALVDWRYLGSIPAQLRIATSALSRPCEALRPPTP